WNDDLHATHEREDLDLGDTRTEPRGAEVELHATHDREHLDVLRNQPRALPNRAAHERAHEAAARDFARRDDRGAADRFRPTRVVGKYGQIREKLRQF